MSDDPSPNLDDKTLPTHSGWDAPDYEAPTRAYWRREVTPEEVAALYKATEPEDYPEAGTYYMKYEVTIDYDHYADDPENAWGVAFGVPTTGSGIGDVDGRFSVSAVTLDEALAHVRTVLSEHAPAK